MLDALGREHDDLAVFDQLHPAGVLEEGGHGGGDELLAVPAADDQGALPARPDQHLGLLDAHRHEREVALELGVGGAHGGGQVVLVVLGDQVGDDLGVGLGAEHAAGGGEALLQLDVVLHDAVDHHVDAVGGVAVGVGVLLADAAVGGPAGVADAGARGPLGDGHGGAAPVGLRGAVGELGAQRAEVADRAHGLDPLRRDHRDPRGVVAAVLQPAESG